MTREELLQWIADNFKLSAEDGEVVCAFGEHLLCCDETTLQAALLQYVRDALQGEKRGYVLPPAATLGVLALLRVDTHQFRPFCNQLVKYRAGRQRESS